MSPIPFGLGLWVLVLFLLCTKVHGLQEYCPEDANVNDACNDGAGSCQVANGNSRKLCVLSTRPGRIINGEDTTTDQHAHQVSLQLYTLDERWVHICGGSVIDGRWILTAAHCVILFKIDDLRVILDQDDTHQVYSLDRIEIFPGYKHGRSPIGLAANDIALMKTSAPMKMAGFYKVELAPAGETFVGVNCTITGWGFVDFTDGRGTGTDVLQITHGTILSNEECLSFWSSKMFNGTHNICIHNEDTGGCFGDSGGPMLCSGVLAGVTSFGSSSCLTGIPTVYTRVNIYLDWINLVVESE